MHDSPARPIPGPIYALATVRAAAATASIGDRVVERMLEALSAAVTAQKARAHIRSELGVLSADHYCESLELDYQEGAVKTDLYGVTCADGYDWYVKFHISNGKLVVVSFHEPDTDKRRKDGTWIKGKYR